jgi:hypothetical protein
MPNRVFIVIQNDIFDLWHFVSAEGDTEYNDAREDFDYLLILNRTAVTTNVKEKVYKFTTEEERDEVLYMLQDKIRQHLTMQIMGEEDGEIEPDNKMDVKKKYKSKPQPDWDEDE